MCDMWCRGHKVPHCIVVRHLSVPRESDLHGKAGDMNDDVYQQVGKRPSRRLEVRLRFLKHFTVACYVLLTSKLLCLHVLNV